MAVAPFICALGDSPAISIAVSAELQIAPPAGMAAPWEPGITDSNRVIVHGAGTITSLGHAYRGEVGELGEIVTVTKRIEFQPDLDQAIELQHNPPWLNLLGGENRTIRAPSFSEFQSDVDGNWTEIGFASSASVPIQGGGGAVIDLVYYLESQTITIPHHARRAWVRMWGGSGGSSAGDGTGGCSGGSGAGGYLEKYLTGLVAGQTLKFTRGNAGAGGVGGVSAGTAGTASILESETQTLAAMLTANGSIGSAGPSGVSGAITPGSLGGTAIGGDINLTGQQGGVGHFGIGPSAPGGSTMLAQGANGTGLGAGNPGTPGGLIIAWFMDFGA